MMFQRQKLFCLCWSRNCSRRECKRRLSAVPYAPSRPPASLVLTSYLKQCDKPPWTSYFVKYSHVTDDQFGMTSFNWPVDTSNYHILRTGCYPYIKYHCTKSAVKSLVLEDRFFRALKLLNFGIPLLLYGLAATMMIRHAEHVHVPGYKRVTIYFLIPEEKGSSY